MKNKFISIVLVILLVMFAAACTPEETETPEPTEPQPDITLTVSGSGSVTPILSAIKDAFEAANPGYFLEVLPGSGSGGGVRGAVDGTLDVAAMSRPAKDDEAEQGIQFVQFGQSGVAVITHPEVGVTELTAEQAADIFLGEITNWSDIGGSDLDIAVFVRDPNESNTTSLRDAYFGDDPFLESAEIMTSQTEMQNIIASIPGSIGFGTWATVVANGADISSVAIDGISPEDLSYPIQVVLGVGYLTDREDDVQPLIDWLLSSEGQTALQAVGVIALATE